MLLKCLGMKPNNKINHNKKGLLTNKHAQLKIIIKNVQMSYLDHMKDKLNLKA